MKNQHMQIDEQLTLEIELASQVQIPAETVCSLFTNALNKDLNPYLK